MKNYELLPLIRERMELAIDALFLDIHQTFDRTTYGDIAPEQAFELDRIKDQLARLIAQQVIQNIDEVPEFEGFSVYHQNHAFILNKLPDVYFEESNENDPIAWVLIADNDPDDLYPYLFLHESGNFSSVCESKNVYGTLDECIELLESFYEFKIL